MGKRLAFVLIIISSLTGAISCDSSIMKEKGPKYTEEHLLLLGDWQQQVDADSVINWKFSLEDMTWGNFTHHYNLEGQTIRVSGMNYIITDQRKDTVDIKAPDQGSIQLVRVGK